MRNINQEAHRQVSEGICPYPRQENAPSTLPPSKVRPGSPRRVVRGIQISV